MPLAFFALNSSVKFSQTVGKDLFSVVFEANIGIFVNKTLQNNLKKI